MSSSTGYRVMMGRSSPSSPPPRAKCFFMIKPLIRHDLTFYRLLLHLSSSSPPLQHSSPSPLLLLYIFLFLFSVFPSFSFTPSCLQVSPSKTPTLHPPTFTLFVLLQSDPPFLLPPSVTPLSFSPSLLPVSHQAEPT